MGCLLGKQDINDIHPDIFSVHNIDHEGRCSNTGNIKVTGNTLELIRLGLPTMVWSLRSLRQYGHDADIFTFESGRRGPQGPGVYSFRCSRAKQLFELVQRNVHRNQEAQQDQPSNRRISVGTVIDENPNEAITTQYINSSPKQPQTEALASPTPPPPPPPPLTLGVTTPATSASMEFANNQYMNVVLPTPSVVAKDEQYENVTLAPKPSFPTPPDVEDPKVSYATLELNPVENSVVVVANPEEHEANNNEMDEMNGRSYAMINLDMTHALSALNAVGQGNTDEGSRRTRHNSTLEGIGAFNANGKTFL